mmetsp:Transcript_8386/g.18803  ORF Transcript_8386/g.18803 Transcript_8386/m.18803 type:complete len:239 (+) Transcript_8386:3025-3741(+)
MCPLLAGVTVPPRTDGIGIAPAGEGIVRGELQYAMADGDVKAGAQPDPAADAMSAASGDGATSPAAPAVAAGSARNSSSSDACAEELERPAVDGRSAALKLAPSPVSLRRRPCNCSCGMRPCIAMGDCIVFLLACSRPANAPSVALLVIGGWTMTQIFGFSGLLATIAQLCSNCCAAASSDGGSSPLLGVSAVSASQSSKTRRDPLGTFSQTLRRGSVQLTSADGFPLLLKETASRAE